jgi:hypothetical protein
MLYPFELRAQPGSTSGDSDYSGKSGVMKCRGTSRLERARSPLSAGPKDFILQDFNSSLAPFMHAARTNVNLSHHRQFLPCTALSAGCIFRRLELANRVQQAWADEVARNGAPLKINFGQRFSWTPLAFSLQPRFHFTWPTAALPKLSSRLPRSRPHNLFMDVQARLPQESCNHRLFEA